MTEPLIIKLITFGQLASAVFFEAAPFLLLGSFVAAVIEFFLDPAAVARFAPRGRFNGLLVGLGAGLILPTCECGVVPVARKLLTKGTPPHVALTYMLAAPVINPVVLISTYVAFQGDIRMVLGRAGLVAVTAGIIGFTLGRTAPGDLLKAGVLSAENQEEHDHDRVDRDDNDDMTWSQVHALTKIRISRKKDQPHKPRGPAAILFQTGTEFLYMGRFLLIGCFASAALKTFIPLDFFNSLENNVFLSVGSMIGLAFLLSVCSEADAFVAASFAFLPVAARLSFVVLGPMADLKLALMLKAVFKPKVTAALIIAPLIIVYSLSVVTGLVIKGWGG